MFIKFLAMEIDNFPMFTGNWERKMKDIGEGNHVLFVSPAFVFARAIKYPLLYWPACVFLLFPLFGAIKTSLMN